MVTAMPLPAGTQLGPYEILAQIGEGGMGEVYRARDTRLGRDVAVKVVNSTFSARFQTEARAIAALNHPNICTLHDIGPSYLVMEFVEGQTLAERLKRGPLPADEAVRLAIVIADALGAAHAKNMAHRDLKPGNVMITPEGRAKLLDFGLAKMFDHSDPGATRTMDGAVLGTFAYMSPEQLQGKPAGSSSDIFSFGALLYEMLSGRRAFPTAGLRDDPPTLTAIDPHIAAAVTRCLSRNPEDRFPRIGDVKSVLERTGATPAAPVEPAASIAVLPFANMSGDKDNEYFSDGLAEEILNSLVRAEGLKVTARTSAFSFRGEKLDIRKIGEALGVRTVLEGSVRRAGNRIRVTAQLINVADGYHLWSERFDRDMTDVFAVQDEISAAIVGALKLKLAPAKPAQRPVNLDAYHALLKARHAGFPLTPENLERARAYAEQAIALDPGYAPAHAFQGAVLVFSAQMGGKPIPETMELARAAASKALELDDKLSEAHMVLAMVAATLDYNWAEALRHYRLASMDPLFAPPATSMVLLPLRRFEEAAGNMEKLVAQDPLSPGPRLILAQALAAAGNYERARKEALQLLELHEKDFSGYIALGNIYTAERKTREAIAILEKGVKVAPWFPPLWGLLAANYHLAGHRLKAKALLMLPRAASLSGHPIVDMARAMYHVIVSEFDQAADYLERAIEARHFGVTGVAWSPLFKEFRHTPRGRALLAKMNLAETASGVA